MYDKNKCTRENISPPYGSKIKASEYSAIAGVGYGIVTLLSYGSPNSTATYSLLFATIVCFIIAIAFRWDEHKIKKSCQNND